MAGAVAVEPEFEEVVEASDNAAAKSGEFFHRGCVPIGWSILKHNVRPEGYSDGNHECEPCGQHLRSE